MRKILSFILLFSLAQSTFAQFYNGLQQDFGKNRVQYDDKFWLYLRYDNYDVYHDKAGKKLAEFVAQNVDSNYAEIKRILEFEYSRRIVFVVYNTMDDFRQSNIGYSTSDDEYNVGGTTQIIDNKVVLYFNGDHNDLVRQIRKGIAEVMMSEFLFGVGAYRKILSNTDLAAYPDWFFDGMTEYFSNSWNAQKEELFSQRVKVGAYKKLSDLYGDDAIFIGQALWVYIGQKYGDKTVANILYMSKLTDDIDASFQYLLGKDLRMVLLEMTSYYQQKDSSPENPIVSNVDIPKRLTKRAITDVSLNSDASKIVFVTNKKGKTGIWVYDFGTQKTTNIFRYGSMVEQITDYSYPIVRWHPSLNALAFFYEKKGRLWFSIYNLETKEMMTREFFHFEQVLDFSYAPDGTKIVFSGAQGGQTDVFTYNIQTYENEQITNDKADERFPLYVQNGSKILFSSNRADDDLQNYQTQLQPTYDLFLLAGKSLERLETSSASELRPLELRKGEYAYMSDRNGLTNLFSVSRDSTVSYVDTAMHYSYTTKNFAITPESFNVLNYSVSNGTLVQLRQQNKRQYLNKSEINSNEYVPVSSQQPQITNQTPITDTVTNSSVDTIAWQRKSSDLYKTNFYVNTLVNQLDFSFVNTGYQKFTGGAYDYSQKVNVLLKLGIIDLFENYRLTGAYRFTGSLGTNEYLLSVENLSKLIDRQYIFHRQSGLTFGSNGSSNYERVQDNNLILRLKYPLSQLQSVTVTPNFRYVRNVTLATDMSSLEKPTVDEYWVGVSCNYVYDNVRKRDLNIYNGTRAKVFAEAFAQLNKSDSYLTVFGLDVRHYQKIHRNLIFASRVAYSTSYGTSPLLYYLGAVDNWLNLFSRYQTYNANIQYDHSVDWAYQAVGTNMRGFSQNIRNGNSFAVANFELRWPIIQYFVVKPMKSDILRNFQVIGFFDVGGAWSGLLPGQKENAYKYTIVEQNPIYVEIDEMRQPFVCGYGFGFRTRIFGYFMRLDNSWGYDEGEVQKMLQFSLGMDF